RRRVSSSRSLARRLGSPTLRSSFIGPRLASSPPRSISHVVTSPAPFRQFIAPGYSLWRDSCCLYWRQLRGLALALRRGKEELSRETTHGLGRDQRPLALLREVLGRSEVAAGGREPDASHRHVAGSAEAS